MKSNDELGDWRDYTVRARYLPGTNIVLEEQWYHAALDGELGRNHAPAVLEWDPETLNLIREEYWSFGMLGTPPDSDVAAISHFDPLSGEATKRIWMQKHKKHRGDNLPAVEFIKDGQPLRNEYWIRGELKREDNGPPIVNFDPITGGVISTADCLESERQGVPKPSASLPRFS